MDEIIVVILLLLTMLTTYCIHKMLDKRGLYFGLIMLNLITVALLFKITYVFKLNFSIGIIPLIGSLTIIFLFLSKYGDKESKNLIKISAISNIVISLLFVVMNYFLPAVTETISINMQGTFEYNYKILITYPIIMTISQIAVVKLYSLVRIIQDNIIVCMILTYIITALLYTILYSVLSYIGIMEIKYSLFLGLSTYLIGLPILILNSFLVNYIVKKKVIK